MVATPVARCRCPVCMVKTESQLRCYVLDKGFSGQTILTREEWAKLAGVKVSLRAKRCNTIWVESHPPIPLMSTIFSP